MLCRTVRRRVEWGDAPYCSILASLLLDGDLTGWTSVDLVEGNRHEHDGLRLLVKWEEGAMRFMVRQTHKLGR